LKSSNSTIKIVCDENPTTKHGADNGTNMAFQLLQLYYNNQLAIQTFHKYGPAGVDIDINVGEF
jgi:hypothetical protein